jgi:hypothetical protein
LRARSELGPRGRRSPAAAADHDAHSQSLLG